MTAKDRAALRLIDEDLGALWLLITMIKEAPRRLEFAIREEAAAPLLRELARLRSAREALTARKVKP